VRVGRATTGRVAERLDTVGRRFQHSARHSPHRAALDVLDFRLDGLPGNGRCNQHDCTVESSQRAPTSDGFFDAQRNAILERHYSYLSGGS
jgi:hypothetical protein